MSNRLSRSIGDKLLKPFLEHLKAALIENYCRETSKYFIFPIFKNKTEVAEIIFGLSLKNEELVRNVSRGHILSFFKERIKTEHFG